MKHSGIMLALLLCGGAQADASPQAIFSCMRNNLPPSLSVRTVELSGSDSNGATRLLKGTLSAAATGQPGAVSVRLKIEDPPYLAGAAYLIRHSDSTQRDDMFVYLPSVKRVRHIVGTLADGSLLGTNFSYDDFKQLQTAFDGASAQLGLGEDVDGRASDVLLLSPDPAEHSPYSSVKAWVERKSCVVIKAEFNVGKNVRKRLTSPADALKQSGSYWYLAQMEITDLVDHSSTVLRTLGISNVGTVSPQTFDPTAFYRAP